MRSGVSGSCWSWVPVALVIQKRVSWSVGSVSGSDDRTRVERRGGRARGGRRRPTAAVAAGRSAVARGARRRARTRGARPGCVRDVLVALALDRRRPQRGRRVVHREDRRVARAGRRIGGARRAVGLRDARARHERGPSSTARGSRPRPGRGPRAGGRRYGAHAAISSGSGSRLPGGRHLTMLVMKTSSRRQPMWPSRFTSRPPARPTNGRPSRSSFCPGPRRRTRPPFEGSPSPGTAFVRVSWSRHRVQPRTSAAIASSAARRSASVTRGDPAASRAAAALTQPRSTRISASSTAFVAAPLRRLSLTTQNARPRPPLDRRILPDAPDEDLVAAGRLCRERVGRCRRVVLDDDPGDRANSVRARSG